MNGLLSRYTRRAVITGVLGAFGTGVGLPMGPAEAQARAYRIGYLATRFEAESWKSFLDALREHGWEEGRNIIVEGRWAEGRPERYVELASELATLKLDVIVASGPPALRAMQQATRTTPIVMTAVADPVEMGFVKSLAKPGGNITGVASSAGSGLFSKLLELTRDALPTSKRVGILFNEGNPLNYATAAASEISDAANRLELELVWLPLKIASDIQPALTTAKQRGTDAIIGIGDPLLYAQRDLIHDTAEKYRLPTIWAAREYLSGRGLLAYGSTLRGMLRHARSHLCRSHFARC